MTRFWWVRHGPTHAKAMVGWSDLPADLSDHAAIARLSAALPQGASIVSSDLLRAVTTADTLQATRMRLPHNPDLRELHFGDWELQTHTDVEAENPTLIRQFWDQPGDVSPPHGESWNDLNARVWAATDRLVQLCGNGNIVVVAHFGAILSALQRAGGLTPLQVFSHRIEPFSITEMDYAEGRWCIGRINHVA